MVHAPTPGVSTRAEAASAAKRLMVVYLRPTDDTYRFAANNLPLDQRAVVLKQVGVSFDVVMTSGDGILMASVAVWLSRRLTGEPSLSWKQFERQWPGDLAEGDVEVWAEDTQGRRLDEDGNVIEHGPDELVEVDGFGEPVAPPEPVGVDDPQS